MVLIRIVVRLWESCFMLRQRKRFILLVIQYGITEYIQKAINEFKPEVIALNCCAAETKENGRLIMGAEDVWNVSLAAPEAKLYLTHMDNVAHASVTRFTMRGQLTAYGVSNYDMLEDGGSVVY